MASSQKHIGNVKGKGNPTYGKTTPINPTVRTGMAAKGRATKAKGNWTPRKPAGAAAGGNKGKIYAKVYTDAMIADALRRANGLKTHAAALLGMNPSCICQRINKSIELLKVVDEAKESLLDTAETGLRTGAKRGKGWAVMFALDRLGHKRGYIRPEIAHAPGGGTWAGGLPTDLSEWPKDDLDRLIAAIAARLDTKETQEAFT